MANIEIKINGNTYEVPEGITVLEACRTVGIQIPTLCYLKDLNEIGACRMCVVEVKGAKNLVTACVYPVNAGMEIQTNTPRVINSRIKNLQLLLSNHNRECLSCVRSGNCELQALCRKYDVREDDIYDGAKNVYPIDGSAIHMVRDNNKCILCRRCSAMCEKVQGVAVIGPNERGFNTYLGTPFNMGLGDTSCISCGQCINVCPTGALAEKDYTDQVFRLIADPTKHVVVQVAPSVRASLGEAFGYPIGTEVEGKMASALRMLGFDKVFDTNFSADLTITEEANEFIERVQNGGVLPMITSCSPGWVKYCEHYHPDMIPHLSSCKSPQQMFGAICKSYYAENAGIDPKDIVMVSIMPCTAKKFEIQREDQAANGVPDVDFALTTRELSRMIMRAGIDFRNLPDGYFDDPLGKSSGAGVIFGATGGVMEAALRTAVETLTGEELQNLDFEEVRGTQGIKEASYNVAGLQVNVCVCSGLANANKVLEMVKNGEKNYHFIEVMACPGGCVNGGGQIKQFAEVRNTVDIRALRAKSLYELDKKRPHRKSHENPDIITLYKEYLGSYGSHRAHELLHTSYKARPMYKQK
ncbi:MAG: iron hydrogenase small subunit [Parasporobacterium sp.]|nr:iron hydrogenase small subunit [Parasporobacterium sp.]